MSDELAARLFHSVHDVVWTGLLPLVLLLIIAAWSDVRQHRIPNQLVVAGALIALVLHTWMPRGEGFASPLPGGLGFLASAEGLGLCLLVLFPVFALGLMGAGDVKLIAMVGAFLGPGALLGLAFSIAVAGGLLSLLVALHRGVAGAVLRNLFDALHWGITLAVVPPVTASAKGGHSMPYGVAIAAGTFAYLLFALYQSALIF